MFIIKHYKIFLLISATAVGFSLFSLFYFGLNFGIDFKGGSLLEVRYEEGVPSFEELRVALETNQSEEFNLRASGDKNFLIRSSFLTEEKKADVLEILSLDGRFKPIEERFNSVGPVIGEELKSKAWIAISVTLVATILFIAFAFRTVSLPAGRQANLISSWIYRLVAILALIHDILIPAGLFSFLSFLLGLEVDALFIMALLTILGYSINDTIVIFDRVRENLKSNQETGKRESFEITVGESLDQTFVRSFNTSFTVLLVLLTLFFLGGESIQNFTLVLIAGTIAGAYSSLFLACPALILINNRKAKKT